METGLIRQWDFNRDALCFQCRKEVVQRIQVLPDEIIVTCSDCGAERRYRLERSLVTRHKPRFAGADIPGPGQDAWKFLREARCPNCRNRALHEFTIGEHMASIACPACSYLRKYAFHGYSRSRRWSL